ncbi:estradiol 17-beta-dehydrogenase 8 [Neodiprion fabricii]|uniref:estradiol 17-beta-dehydrogenase 8 n=1 Tax=Neodiprion fabricii TaxID=2872261 RepID=UPI001ED8C9C9|nr:estradiol 17-beta-dehydrogenase 8 [Neodiprion fabricii]
MSGIVAGKLAFVTGAGSGIGRAVCRILAREGAKVIASDQNSKNVADTVATLEGDDHTALTVNVTSSKSINEAFKSVIERYAKPPTLVVNSAGITRDNYMLKLSEEDFDQVINVNLKGTFLVTQIAVKAMVEAGVSNRASVVNIASIIAKLGNIGQTNYSASKAGVVAMTKSASMEFGKFGVRINAVLPGFIKTPMTDAVPEHILGMAAAKSPLNRVGTPDEVAEVVTFLCSNKSSFVHGASIEVTGGYH